MLTHGSLFSGIGGFDLAAAWVGIPTLFQVEKEKYCRQILQQHFPEAKRYDDITTIARGELPSVDIISGGFPCQPFSIAGKQKGRDDDRFLWPEMLRIIRDVKPSWVIAENVRGLITQESGLVFEQVCTDLENEGYEVQPVIIPACAVNAPHRRDRVWFIAHSNHNRKSIGAIYNCKNQMYVANTHSKRLQGWEKSQNIKKKWENTIKQLARLYKLSNWKNFPVKSVIRGGNDGVSRKLDESRIKALGNAIVPQVAYQIFKAILQIEGGK